MNEHLRIAVADDEQDMRDYFEKILPRMGHEVVSVAKNGRQLVEHCRELRPQLVITDIRMPHGGGTELIQRLHAKYPGLPIMVVTGYATAESETELESLRVSQIFEKPRRLDKLGQATDDLKGKNA